MNEFNGITYDPKDANTVLLCKAITKACQKTMSVQIQHAQRTAEAEHARIDKLKERVTKLDGEEIGKVTILWEDREAFMKMVRDFLMRGMILAAILVSIVAGAAAFIGIRIIPMQKSEVNVEEVVQKVIAAMIK